MSATLAPRVVKQPIMLRQDAQNKEINFQPCHSFLARPGEHSKIPGLLEDTVTRAAARCESTASSAGLQRRDATASGISTTSTSTVTAITTFRISDEAPQDKTQM